MRCPYCHENIIIQGRFCPKCGEQIFGRPVESGQAPADSHPPAQRRPGEDVLDIELEGEAEPSAASDEAVGKLCPYCRFPIKSGEETLTCPDCGAVLHADCWRENGGCTSYGCTSSPQAAAARRASGSYAGRAGTYSASGSGYRLGAMPMGAQQLVEAAFEGQCTNVLLFTILQLFFCGGILSIVALAWSWSLLSQMKRLQISASTSRSKVIAAVVISGAVTLLWIAYLLWTLSNAG